MSITFPIAMQNYGIFHIMPSIKRNISYILMLNNIKRLKMNGLELKELRKKLGVTQLELASILGVDVKTVQNWEYGRTIPKSKDGILRNLENNPRFVFGGQHVQNGDAINGNKVISESEKANHVIDADSGALNHALNEITEMRKLLSSALEANQRTNDRLLTLLENMHKQ
ncbi:MAG: helix-turn-helix domain-containing protein [Muribaculaceae bacterium]